MSKPHTIWKGSQYEHTVPTTRDRVVQAALKLVLEPIFEADFKPCSYGFRPKRRAQDAIAEIHFYTSRTYEWVFEADITACLDVASHCSLV
jgi:RNA-directed DNA polymerase